MVELITLRWDASKSWYDDGDVGGCLLHLANVRRVAALVCSAIAPYWTDRLRSISTDFEALNDFAQEAEVFLAPILAVIREPIEA